MAAFLRSSRPFTCVRKKMALWVYFLDFFGDLIVSFWAMRIRAVSFTNSRPMINSDPCHERKDANVVILLVFESRIRNGT